MMGGFTVTIHDRKNKKKVTYWTPYLRETRTWESDWEGRMVQDVAEVNLKFIADFKRPKIKRKIKRGKNGI